MPTTLPTIGILGGMGPAASADFYQRLVRIAQYEYGADQDTDFPPMHLYSLPLVGFDETGFTEPAAVRDQLAAGVRKLESAGSDFIVIPCNTVHAFYEDMQSAIGIPILSITNSVVEAVLDRKLTTVAVLSSESTRTCGLYENACSARGVRVLSVTEREQQVLNAVIHHVMLGTQGEADVAALKGSIERLTGEGAEAIVLGCTELPLAITQADISVPLLGSTDILARAALAHAYSKGR